MKPLVVLGFGLVSQVVSAAPTAEESEIVESSLAADIKTSSKVSYSNMEHMQILGRSDKLRTEAGSATLIDELALEKMEYDDIHRILANVPGVNIRQEDGYGLRPNIGFRGVTPERSKKINILEDGVLIGPAPYSAPAAYYFPSVNLMTSVEVFKGPAAIKYGPNTVAGTLNMTTRAIPDSSEGMFELGMGSNGYQKVHGYFGDSLNLGNQDFGFLIEGLSTQADGFKDIDNVEQSDFDNDSGFIKNDLVAKVNYQFDSTIFGQEANHYVELKLGYSDEDSNETYMGLTDADFKASPYRRYAVSQVGNMDWRHDQAMLTYNVRTDDINWTTRVYNNEFERAWRKVNGFFSRSTDPAPTLQEIIADPTAHENFYQVLTGDRDSSEVKEQLVVGTNDRSYYSRGIQTDLTYAFNLFDIENIISTGLRYHQDRIDRGHFEQNYLMNSGVMTADQVGTRFTTVNYEKATALSFYIEDTVQLDQLQLSVGARSENVESRFQNLKAGSETDWQEKDSTVWLYSISGFYTLNEQMGLFVGAHEGYVPTSPKQPSVTKPEKSINYELGGRYNDGHTKLESVLFFNDFKNLKESCSFSTSASCTNTVKLDQEYNGGEVDVYGLEFNVESRFALNDNLDMPWSITYTYTDSEFKQDLESTFELWGNVKAGDPVPYLPENQLTLNLGVENSKWQINLLIKYISEMHEAAGTEVSLSGLSTDSYTVVDVSANYDLGDYGLVYVKVDNLFDDVAIVSRRPFGARPSKPQQMFVGYKYMF